MDDYEFIEKRMAELYGNGARTAESQKSIGDFMLSENHPVNVKSNNIHKTNYSPNMISAKRLVSWLSNNEKHLSFIFVDYEKVGKEIKIIKDSGLIPVEHISWKCLSIQAQGWGVIQLCSDLKIDTNQDRKGFLKGLRVAYESYIEKEREKLVKIEELIKDL